MYRAVALSVSFVAITWATVATADPPTLKGPYGFTGTAACLVALNGFDPTLRPNPPDRTFSRSFSVEGIRTFNGDGTGTVKGTAVGIVVPPALGTSAGSGDFSFSFTYTVNGDGSWTSMMVPGSYTESFSTGPRTGQTATVDAIPPIVGMISQNGMTLTGAHLTPTVETHTYSNGDVEPQICHRSRVFINLPNGK
jgi:hypothetical protein